MIFLASGLPGAPGSTFNHCIEKQFFFWFWTLSLPSSTGTPSLPHWQMEEGSSQDTFFVLITCAFTNLAPLLGFDDIKQTMDFPVPLLQTFRRLFDMRFDVLVFLLTSCPEGPPQRCHGEVTLFAHPVIIVDTLQPAITHCLVRNTHIERKLTEASQISLGLPLSLDGKMRRCFLETLPDLVLSQTPGGAGWVPAGCPHGCPEHPSLPTQELHWRALVLGHDEQSHLQGVHLLFHRVTAASSEAY